MAPNSLRRNLFLVCLALSFSQWQEASCQEQEEVVIGTDTEMVSTGFILTSTTSFKSRPLEVMSKEGYCVSYYALVRDQPATLTVSVYSDEASGQEQMKKPFDEKIPSNDELTLHFFDITKLVENSTITVEMNLKAAKGKAEEVIISDVEFTPGTCQLIDGTCTFSNWKACGFTNTEKYKENGWTVRQAKYAIKSKNKEYFPKVDFTIGSKNGFYAGVQVNGKNPTAEVNSKEISANVSCIRFYWVINGAGTLQILREKSDTVVKEYKNTGKNAEIRKQNALSWYWGSAEIAYDKPFKVQFRAQAPEGAGDEDFTYIAIDNVQISSRSCKAPSAQDPIPTQAPISKKSTCNFEETCVSDWISLNGDLQWEWEVKTAKDIESSPRFDHTTSSQNGHFHFVSVPETANLGENGDKVTLTGPAYDRTHDNSDHNCFSFWYFMDGPKVPRLSASFEYSSNNFGRLWSREGNQGPAWKQAFVSTPYPGRELGHIEFEVVATQPGKVAIDDIVVYDGPCPVSNNLCDMETSYLSGYDRGGWERNTAESFSRRAGIKVDHTTDTKNGYFALADTSQKALIDNPEFMSPRNFPTSGRCLKFFYHIKGSRTEDEEALKVMIYLETGDQYILGAYSGSKDEEGVWQQAELNIVSYDYFKLTQYSCQNSYGCDFEDGFCSWRNGLRGETQLDWQIISGGHLPKGETGPTRDVTLNREYGHFLLLSTLAPAKQNEKAILVSQELNFGSCLTFYYSMIGSHAGGLQVQISNSRDYEDPITLWQRYGGQGQPPVWRYAKVDLWNSTTKVNRVKDYQLRFVGIVGSQLGSDIAIDEIQIHGDYCANVMSDDEYMVDCKDGATQIKRSQVCNFIPDCPDRSDENDCGDCNFGKGYCRYVDVSNGESVWTSSKVADSYDVKEIPPRPAESPESKTGNFLLVTLDDASNGGSRTADLETDFYFGPSPESCQVRFSYLTTANVNGNPLLKLVVRQSALETTVFETSIHARVWKTETIDIGGIDAPFKLAFLGSKKFGAYAGAVAIDDITMVNCKFPPAGKETCDKDEFMCERRACVQASAVCDFANNCGDQSDETDCDELYILRINFEDGYGEWSGSVSDGGTQWVLQQGRTAKLSYGIYYEPGRDHTLGTLDGHYILLYKDQSVKGGKNVARIISPVIKASDPKIKCHVRFFYYIYGYTIVNTLNVYVRTSQLGGEQKIFNRYTSHDQAWTKADVKIDILDQDFQIIFEGQHDTTASSVAVDDISLFGCSYSSTKKLPNGEPTTTPKPCAKSEFRCDNGQCISANKVQYCNFVNDCSDGSDEKNCGTCDFEKDGMCGWSDESRGIFSWVQRGVYQQILPETDGTYKTPGLGHFLLLDTNSAGSDKTSAILISPRIFKTDPGCKLTFNYYTNIAAERRIDRYLHVGLQSYHELGTDEISLLPMLSSPEIKRGVWNKVSYGVTVNSNTFWLTIRHDYQDFEEKNPTIAIDDIKFENCAPQGVLVDLTKSMAPLECDFRSQTFCDYHQATNLNSDLQWVHSYMVDHNGKQAFGAVAMSFGNMKMSQYATLSSNWIKPSSTGGNICLNFWYLTFGTTLNILVRESVGVSEQTQLMFSHFNYEYLWHHETVNIPTLSQPYLIEFSAASGQHSELLYLSDVTAKLEKCPEKPLCDFEQGICGYTSEGETKWERSHYQYNSDRPVSDHTDKDASGHYMYVRESETSTEGRTSFLSPLITQDATKDSCTYFWYYLKSSADFDVGTLIATTKPAISSRPISYFKAEGRYVESVWHQGRLTIPKSTGQYNLKFEAIPSPSGHYGDILIDDIENVPGMPCPTAGSCDFDKDMCGYISLNPNDTSASDTNTPARWLRLVNDHPLSTYGPKKEHTGNFLNGGYAFSDQFVSRLEEFGKKSLMISPFMNPNSKGCVSFWYFFDGPAIGHLTITVADHYIFEVETKFEQWRQGFLDYSSSIPHRIKFEATRDTTAPGSVAIDDIVVSDVPCSELKTTQAPKPKQRTTPKPTQAPPPKVDPVAPVPSKGSSAADDAKSNCNRYCKYWATCHHNRDNTVNCVCQAGYEGPRCDQPKEAKKVNPVVPIVPPVSPSKKPDTSKRSDTSSSGSTYSSSAGVIVGVIFALIGFAVLGFGVFIFLARTNKVQAPPVFRRTLPGLFPSKSDGAENPAYSFTNHPHPQESEISNPVYEPDGELDSQI